MNITGGASGRRRPMNPATILVLGFLVIILVGTGLLMLPFAAEDGVVISPFQALFTATSATCVTGLMVVDAAAAFSLFGEIVILCLIQLGGLGFMLFATSLLVLSGKRISLRNRVLLHETMSMPGLSGIVRNTLRFVLIVFGVEFVGAVLLSIHFVPRLGAAQGAYFAVFHAISAFCNAGIDLFGTAGSLSNFVDDPLVLLTIAFLLILGGLGFAVLANVMEVGRHKKRLALHSKIVLSTTGFLILTATLYFALAEWNNPATLAASGATTQSRLLNAFFQAVTPRTAGFYSLAQNGLHDASKAVTIFLMLVGASPASTGGGVKTTTLFVLFAIIRSVLSGRDDVNAFKKRLPLVLIRTALSIFMLYLLLLFAGSVLMGLLEQPRGFAMIDLVFEEASALGTVGLSAAGTPLLTLPSQIWLTLLMFVGRVGPLTMMLSITLRHMGQKSMARYPEDEIIVG